MLLLLLGGGCREVAHDPASRSAAPALEEADATVDEDAATPSPTVEPYPDWATEDPPPPPFPPPPQGG